VPTNTETVGRESQARESQARDRIQEARESNGQRQDEATREQVRADQDRFAQLQDRYQQQAQDQAEEVKRQLQHANESGREALAQYVRALTRGYQAFIPQAVIDPRQVIDIAADVAVQGFELQRSLLHELVNAGQNNARATSRAAENVSDDR
jgi:hypothetical protein